MPLEGSASRAPAPWEAIVVNVLKVNTVRLVTYVPGQSIVCRTMRPVLATLGIEHHAITRLGEAHFIADRMIKQAYATQAAAAGAKNLAIVVFDNGVYQITGSQPTFTSHGTDHVAIAKASGLNQSAWAADEAHFEALIDRALQDDGPQLIEARTDASLPAGVTERDVAKIRGRFMEGLGVKA